MLSCQKSCAIFGVITDRKLRKVLIVCIYLGIHIAGENIPRRFFWAGASDLQGLHDGPCHLEPARVRASSERDRFSTLRVARFQQVLKC